MQPQKDNTSGAKSARAGRVLLPHAVLISGIVAVLLASAAGVCWGLEEESRARGGARVHEVRTAAQLLARQAERVIGWDEAGTLPALLDEAALAHDLLTCTVRVPGEAVLAAAGKDGPSAGVIPSDLPAAVQRSDSVRDDVATIVVPIRVAGRGELALEVTASVGSSWNTSLAKLGVPIVLSSGLVALLLAHRVVRRRLKALGKVEQALEASGRIDGDALRVPESLGGGAQAWNDLVREREALRKFAAFKEAAEPAGGAAASSELSAACDVLSQGLLILDDRLRVKYANGAAATLLAAKRDTLGGMDIRTFVNDTDVITALEGVASGKTRQRVSVETSRVGPQGRMAEVTPERAGSVLRFTARPVRRDEHGVVMLVVEDVTQQKVADEARNSFVAQATHELRTPLTNIRLYTEAMIEDNENAEMRVKALNVISSESRRLERIVSDMLSVSEIEAGTLRVVKGDVRLDQLFDDLKHDYKILAEDKEISLVFELPPRMPVVLGDRDKLALALHNLIGNALKYTPAGGVVTVRAQEAPGQFLVHVVDNGIGVRKEEHDLIFDKFYRAKDPRVGNLTGTGLGLTLARDIARMHGGNIVVQSELNKGSTFTLELPLLAPEAGEKAA
jgi:signal transduction histidine kinase